MRLGKYGKVLHVDTVAIGEGYIKRYTLVELKWFGGLILNVYHTREQDRFHTHAFSAVSLMLWGHYRESILLPTGQTTSRVRKAPDICYLPRSLCHKIMESTPGAVSITLMGPWHKTWKEIHQGNKVRTFTWGRHRTT